MTDWADESALQEFRARGMDILAAKTENKGNRGRKRAGVPAVTVCVEIGNEKTCVGWTVLALSAKGGDRAARGSASLKAANIDAALAGLAAPGQEAAPDIPDIRESYRRTKAMARLDSKPYSRMCQSGIILRKIFSAFGAPSRIVLRSHSTLIGDLAKRPLKALGERGEKLSEIQARVREKYAHIYVSLSQPARLKLTLHEEQKGMCPYSMRKIDKKRLLADLSYADVDHILPLSRSRDDSYENKVLVLIGENRKKRDRTPREFFGDDAKRWAKYEKWVLKTIASPEKRDRMLCAEQSEPADENRPAVENLALWIAEWAARAGTEIVTEFLSGKTEASLIRMIGESAKLDGAAFAELLKKTLPVVVPPPKAPARKPKEPKQAKQQRQKQRPSARVYVKDGRHWIAADGAKAAGNGKTPAIDASFKLICVLTPQTDISIVKRNGDVVYGRFAGINASNGSLRLRESGGKNREVSARRIQSIEAKDAPNGGGAAKERKRTSAGKA
jgi:hypothetical protein